MFDKLDDLLIRFEEVLNELGEKIEIAVLLCRHIVLIEFAAFQGES